MRISQLLLQVLLTTALLSSSPGTFAGEAPTDVNAIRLLKQYALAPSAECQSLLPVALNTFRNGKYNIFGPQLAPIFIASVKRVDEDQFAEEFVGPERSYPVFLMQKQLDNTFTSLFVDCERKVVYMASFGGFSEGQSWFGPFNLE